MEENNKQNANLNSNGATKNFNVSSEPAPKKKGKGGIVFAIIAIILVLAIAGGLAYYFMYYTKPEQIYKRLLSSNYDKYTSAITDTDYKTVKTDIKLGVKVDTDSEDVDEDILDLINKTSIELETQTDFENKKVVVNLDSNYDKKTLLNAQLYSDAEDEKTYVYLKDLFNKYIELDMSEISSSETDYYSLLNEALELNDKKADIEKATKIVKRELLNVIKTEYCSSSKEKITVNEKEITATKNTLKMTGKQFVGEFKTIVNNLKENNNFINCFEDKEDVKESLENILESIDEEEIDEDSIIEINIYTQGLMNEVVKVSAIAETSEENVTMEVTKVEENKYAFEVKSEGEEDNSLNGTVYVENINDNEGKLNIEFNVENLGKAALNIEYSKKYNENIDEVNVKDSVELDDLTVADQKTMYTNFQKSPLYEIIAGFMGGSKSSTKNNSLLDVTTMETDEENEDEEETKTTGTSKNQILTYDDKTKITFGVPEGYEVNTTSENFKRLDKGESSLRISSTIGKEESYFENIKEKADRYKEDEKYKDVSVTDAETMEVGNTKFYTSTLKYTYVSGTYEHEYTTRYIWTKANDRYIVEMQATNAEEIAENELQEILTMEIEDVK